MDDLLRTANIPSEHPANEFLLDAALEDAVQGGQEGLDRLLRRRSGRVISRSDLIQARARNDRDGEAGEQFVHDFLQAQMHAGTVVGIDWASRSNPVSPFDFAVQGQDASFRLDVKSTRGEFARHLHLSIGQLVEIVRGQERFDLYRVYEMDDDSTKLRIAQDVKPFAQSVLATLANLPKGVTVDSISVLPAEIPGWGEEISLSLAIEEE